MELLTKLKQAYEGFDVERIAELDSELRKQLETDKPLTTCSDKELVRQYQLAVQNFDAERYDEVRNELIAAMQNA